jgi:hypothetical protein
MMDEVLNPNNPYYAHACILPIECYHKLHKVQRKRATSKIIVFKIETRERKGILNTERRAADRFHQTELLERYIVGCMHSIEESSYGDAPRCQSNVCWEDIDLVQSL